MKFFLRYKKLNTLYINSPFKAPKYKQYQRKFRKVWLKDEAFKDWITSSEADENKAHCKYYGCDLNAKYHDLKLHA